MIEELYSKSIDHRGAISSSPCVIINRESGLFLAKGWRWYREMSWVSDWKKARIFQNSTGAKNAVVLAGNYNNIIEDIFVVELSLIIDNNDKVKKWQNDLKSNAIKKLAHTFGVDEE